MKGMSNSITFELFCHDTARKSFLREHFVVVVHFYSPPENRCTCFGIRWDTIRETLLMIQSSTRENATCQSKCSSSKQCTRSKNRCFVSFSLTLSLILLLFHHSMGSCCCIASLLMWKVHSRAKRRIASIVDGGSTEWKRGHNSFSLLWFHESIRNRVHAETFDRHWIGKSNGNIIVDSRADMYLTTLRNSFFFFYSRRKTEIKPTSSIWNHRSVAKNARWNTLICALIIRNIIIYLFECFPSGVNKLHE